MENKTITQEWLDAGLVTFSEDDLQDKFFDPYLRQKYGTKTTVCGQVYDSAGAFYALDQDRYLDWFVDWKNFQSDLVCLMMENEPYWDDDLRFYTFQHELDRIESLLGKTSN